MNINIIAIGKEKDFAGSGLVLEYSERISHYLPINWRYISASDPDAEAVSIVKALDAVGTGSYAVILDDKGAELDSLGFAALLQERMNDSVRSLIFIIGGSHGVGKRVHEHVKEKISLSRLTFPHQLVRLILAEQIYRACTILKGEKYHHR